MTFGKWLGIVCALCVSAPVQPRTATDLVAPEASSFAYAKRHALWPLPDSALKRAADPDKFAQVLNAVFYRDESSRKPLDPRAGVPHRMSLRAFCDSLFVTAQQHDLPVQFFANLIWQESRFKVYSVSWAGALGIAQFMPRTAELYGLINPFEPIHSINASARYLRDLRAQFGNLGLAAMAYNAGPRRVLDWMARRGALPGETRNYIVRITGRSAERWTGEDSRIDLQMSLMPLKAPCPEMRLAAREEVGRARIASLIAELAQATSLPATNKPGRTDAKIADGQSRNTEAGARSHRHRTGRGIRWAAHKSSRSRHSRHHPPHSDVASSR